MSDIVSSENRDLVVLETWDAGMGLTPSKKITEYGCREFCEEYIRKAKRLDAVFGDSSVYGILSQDEAEKLVAENSEFRVKELREFRYRVFGELLVA